MNPSKQKGTSFETAMARYLQQIWPTAERRALAGTADRGDIAGIPGWVLELKNTRTIDLAGAVDEADREARNAGDPWFAAIIKRRGKAIDQAYAVMPMWQFVQLMKAAEK